MSEPTVITRDQAILGFMRIKYPDEVAETEKLVDKLVEAGMAMAEARAEREESNAD